MEIQEVKPMSRNYIALLAAVVGMLCLAMVLQTDTGGQSVSLRPPVFVSSLFALAEPSR